MSKEKGSTQYKFFSLPVNFERIRKLGFRDFQVWMALYYLHQKENFPEWLKVTPYKLRNKPFLLTYMKNKNIEESLVNLMQHDGCLLNLKKEKQYKIKMVKPANKFNIPVEYITYSLFKNGILNCQEDKTALLYLFKAKYKVGGNIDSEFTIDLKEIKNSLNNMLGKNCKIIDVLTRLQDRSIIKYSFSPSKNKKKIVKITFTWDEFRSRYKEKRLRIVSGFTRKSSKTYKKILENIKSEKSQSNTDFLMTAIIIDEIFDRFDDISLDKEEFINQLISGYRKISSKGRYTLQNLMTTNFEKIGVVSHWQDFNLPCFQETKEKVIEIKERQYRHFLFMPYFYPGSKVCNNIDSLSYSFCAQIDFKSLDMYNSEVLHSFKISNYNKLQNACRGAFTCILPIGNDKTNRIALRVSSKADFLSLNLRTFIALK